MQISNAIEGGRIEVVRITASRRRSIEAVLAIPTDVGAPQFRQWFCFVVEGAPAGKKVSLRIQNAGACTWGDAFGGLYKAYASHDGRKWFRLPTHFDGNALICTIDAAMPRTIVAYYPLYPFGRLHRLLARVRRAGGATTTLGTTARGTPIWLASFADASRSAPAVWMIAQQHPGEHMAGWYVEGVIETLMTSAARRLRAKANFFVAPCLNPDGCNVGNHRTNTAGVDLNRQWNETRPVVEVACVREAIEKKGANLFIDVHGDERLPYVFFQPGDAGTAPRRRLIDLETRLSRAMLRRAPDFQVEHRYTHDRPTTPYLPIAANWIQHRLRCLALTLEMPFSDNALRPRPEGWSPARAKRLGRQTVQAIGDVLVHLKRKR